MKRWSGLWVGMACVLSGSACGSGNTFTGSIGGKALKIRDAVFAIVPAHDTSPEELIVVLSDTADLCNTMHAGIVKKTSTSLILRVAAAQASAHVSTGTTPVGAEPPVSATFGVSDSDCSFISATGMYHVATAGSITIGSLDATTRTEGSYTLAFHSDTVRGAFAPTYCGDVPIFLSKVLAGSTTCE